MTPFQYTIVRSKRRRLSAALQVSLKGEIIVQAPWYMPRFVLDKFVADHTSWIKKRLAESSEVVGPRQKHFADAQALQDFVVIKLRYYENLMALHSTGIIFKQVKTYWGCCSPSGRIAFNLELVYAPPEAVEYIIVHELAHLKYRGHGARFWGLVNRYYPESEKIRTLLRGIGHSSRLARD